MKGLAENSRSVIFNKALDNADELQKESDDTYVESFFKSFDAIKGDLKLASPEIFANRTLSDEVNFNMTDDEVKPIILQKIDASITSAFEVLRKRIDKFGVTQPNIQRLGNSGRILVELPGANDVERVQKLLQSTAQLEFWETISNQSFNVFLNQANSLLLNDKELEKKNENLEISEIDELLSEVSSQEDSLITVVNPIFDLIKEGGYPGGPVIMKLDSKDQPTMNAYLNRPDVRSLLPVSYTHLTLPTIYSV